MFIKTNFSDILTLSILNTRDLQDCSAGTNSIFYGLSDLDICFQTNFNCNQYC